MNSQNLVDVIFLDIDGVLLPFGATRDNCSKKNALTYTNACLFPDCTMDALTTLLQRIQSIQGNPVLVLSSTWRAQSHFIQDILASFRVYVEEKGEEDASTMLAWGDHLNAFFDICDPNFHSTRHDEIYKWVNDNVVTQNTMQHTSKSKNKKNAKGQYTVRSWIALDDEDLVNVEGRVLEDAKKHAVQTKSSVGLTLEYVDLGVELIKMQIQEFRAGVLRDGK